VEERPLSGGTWSSEIVTRVRDIAARADLIAMALPRDPTSAEEPAIRRLVLLLALWQIERSSGGPECAATPESRAAVLDARRQVGVDHADETFLGELSVARGRFSFYDTRAANWVFGQALAAAIGFKDDFAYVAPAAAWAIHALNEAASVPARPPPDPAS